MVQSAGHNNSQEAPVAARRMKQIRAVRFNQLLCIAVGAALFLVLLVPMTMLLGRLFKPIIEFAFDSDLGGAILSTVIAVIVLATYLFARSGYSLLRYRLIEVPIEACELCHYDLVNNVSGICPECGQPILLHNRTLPFRHRRMHRMVCIVGIATIAISIVVLLFPSRTISILGLGPPAPMAPPAAWPTPLLPKIPVGAGTMIANPSDDADALDISGSVHLSANHSRSQSGLATLLADCVVYIENGPTNGAIAKTTPVILDFVPGNFSPLIVCLQTGQTLTVRNRDAVARNFLMINMAGKNPPQNCVVPTTGMMFSTSFAVPERNIAIVDAVYPAAGPVRMHVFAHPYFAVTDVRGEFRMPGLPAGTYELVCEHETYGRITSEITIDDKTAATVVEIEYDDSK